MHADDICPYSSEFAVPQLTRRGFSTKKSRPSQDLRDHDVIDILRGRLPHDVIDHLETEGKTLMLVGTHTHIIGVIGLKDRIRDASAGTLRALTARGIKTVMLTGDNERAGAAIASELPLSECYAELLPEDKVRHVDELATA